MCPAISLAAHTRAARAERLCPLPGFPGLSVRSLPAGWVATSRPANCAGQAATIAPPRAFLCGEFK